MSTLLKFIISLNVTFFIINALFAGIALAMGELKAFILHALVSLLCGLSSYRVEDFKKKEDL